MKHSDCTELLYSSGLDDNSAAIPWSLVSIGLLSFILLRLVWRIHLWSSKLHMRSKTTWEEKVREGNGALFNLLAWELTKGVDLLKLWGSGLSAHKCQGGLICDLTTQPINAEGSELFIFIHLSTASVRSCNTINKIRVPICIYRYYRYLIL